MNKFNFYNVVNNINSERSEINKFKNVVYRIHHISLNKDYIGIAKNMKSRLFGVWGYVRVIELGSNLSPIHKAILDYGYKDFDIYIEYSSDNYQDICDNESVYIIKYDSYNKGYNESLDGKGGKSSMTWITNGIDDKRINLLKESIPDGWKLGHLFKPNEGKIHINNGISQIYVNKNELQMYLDNGYVIGSLNKPVNNKIKINNGVICKYIDKSDTIPEEFKIGGLNKEGQVWINDGIKNYRVYKSELEYKLSNGFIRGKIPGTGKRSVKQIWVNKNGSRKLVNILEKDKYLSDNWSLGM